MNDKLIYLRRIIRTLPYVVTALEWKPDGSQLLIGDNFGVIRVWDKNKETYVVRQEAHSSSITGVSWSPTGDWFCTSSENGFIKFWGYNSIDSKIFLIDELFIDGRGLRQISVSPTGNTVAIDTNVGIIRFWDMRSKSWMQSLNGSHEFKSNLSWSLKQDSLAFANQNGDICIWRERSGFASHYLNDDNYYFLGPSWSPDGYKIVAGTLNGEICFWDTRENEWEDITKIASSHVLNALWSPDGKSIVTETQNKSIQVWDLTSNKLIKTFRDYYHKTGNLVWTPDGSSLTHGDNNGDIRFWGIQQSLKEELIKSSHIGTVKEEGYENSQIKSSTVIWGPQEKTIITNLDGANIIASGAEDGIRSLWLEKSSNYIEDIALSQNGKLLALAVENESIKVLDLQSRKQFIEISETFNTTKFSWSFDSNYLAVGSLHGEILIWSVTENIIVETIFIDTYANYIHCIAWSPTSLKLAFIAEDDPVYFYDFNKEKITFELPSSAGSTCCAWSYDESMLAVGNVNGSVSIFYLENQDELRTLEGHGEKIIDLIWSVDGQTLMSVSDDCVFLWLCHSWEAFEIFGRVPMGYVTESVSVSDQKPISLSIPEGVEIQTTEFDFSKAFASQNSTVSISYTSAKVVLVGESNVGKSCLAHRLAEDTYKELATTHGMRTWIVSPEKICSEFEVPPNEKMEIILWDMGGQDEYRLIHQLFLHDTTLALILFDPTRGRIAFEEVKEWGLRLEKQLDNRKATKLLVGTKLDEKSDLIDRVEIKTFVEKYGFKDYFETSAKNGRGTPKLSNALVNSIDWKALSKTTRLILFQRIRDGIDEKIKAGEVVILYSDLEKEIKTKEIDYDPNAVNTVVRQLSLQGVIVDTKLTSGERALILQVGEVERYAGSLIVEARNNKFGIPAIETFSIISKQSYLGIKNKDRLPPIQERIVIECVVQLLIERNICLIHENLLIFPSLFKEAERETNVIEEISSASIYYDFSGAIDNIYTTLVVRLAMSNGFGRVRMWKDGADFEKPKLGFCGIRKITKSNGYAHLDLVFSENVPDETKRLFTLFIEDHLKKEGVTITEGLNLSCSGCGKYSFEEWVLKERLDEGAREVTCPRCDKRLSIMGGAVQLREDDADIVRRLIALKTETDLNTKQAMTRMKDTIDNMTRDITKNEILDNSHINILHLSDLHINKDDDAFALFQPLLQDIEDKRDGLGLNQVHYLIVSGDLTNRATAEEFESAHKFISELMERLKLTPQQCIIVPGNHDQSWDIENIYRWRKKREIDISKIKEGSYIALGNDFAIRDEPNYKKRFENFSKFYHSLFQKNYSLDPNEQFDSFLFTDTKVQFISLNSSWEIDEYFPDRSSINMNALARCLIIAKQQIADAIKAGEIKSDSEVTKIAVWHHPVTGNEKIKDESFLEILQAFDVKLCLHGHIHEEKAELLFHLHPKRKVHIAGTGTFGAVAQHRPPSTPKLYNLIQINNDGTIRVHTRARRKDGGKWSGWNMYPSETQNEGRSYYDIL